MDIKDVSKKGDRLSFTSYNARRAKEMTLTYDNPYYDGVTMIERSDDGSHVEAVWKRTKDGTETYNSKASSGEITRYMERSDCSGTVFLERGHSSGQIRRTEFEWSSVLKDDFTLSYKICKIGDDGTQDCKTGQI